MSFFKKIKPKSSVKKEVFIVDGVIMDLPKPFFPRKLFTDIPKREFMEMTHTITVK